MAQHHSTGFYDLKRILPANIDADNIAFAVFRPLATRPAFLSDKSVNGMNFDLEPILR